jgi:hypothetical protein
MRRIDTMDDKILTEMLSVMKELKERLPAAAVNVVRGPVGDPGPDWIGHLPNVQWRYNLRGPVGDPATGPLLDKAKLAQLKVHQLDGLIGDIKNQMEGLVLERDLLKKEYKL